MDHSNLANQKYSHGQCVHGMCLDHEPEWENVGEMRREPPNPRAGKKTLGAGRCCGWPMIKIIEVQTQRCKKCGRQRDEIISCHSVLCRCCGMHFLEVSDGSDNFMYI